jgi:hypothetical protein
MLSVGMLLISLGKVVPSGDVLFSLSWIEVIKDWSGGRGLTREETWDKYIDTPDESTTL